jgi:hypothetical protein
MAKPEKIQGKQLFRLMEKLEREKIMLSMRLVGQNYERLTMVTHIPKNKRASFFAIDPLRDFRNIIAKIKTWEIHFKFNGSDNLEYIFTTFGGKFSGNETRIPFPDYIERLQRRRNFRLPVPTGTTLFFEQENVQREIGLINISLGGALGVLKTFHEEAHQKPVFKKEDYLKNIELVFPSDQNNNERKLRVKKVIIRRIEHDQQNKIGKYAFKFVRMGRDEEKRLVEIIYNIQRSFLQRKL